MSRRSGNVLDDFDVLDVLGKGQFGAVYRARERATNGVFALKKVAVRHDATARRDVEFEAATLQLCAKSSHVVGLFGVWHNDDDVWLVLELCEHGSLADVLRRTAQRAFEASQVAYVARCVLSALQCVHAHSVVHRDVKPDNVLLTSDGALRLADFGIAAPLVDATHKRRSVIGTSHYLAPEIILSEGYGCAVDIWSLGLSLIELLDGRHPYAGQDAFRVMYLISAAPAPVAAAAAAGAAPPLADLVARCLQKRADARATAADLLLHQCIVECPIAALDTRQLLAAEKPSLEATPTPMIAREPVAAMQMPPQVVATTTPPMMMPPQLAGFVTKAVPTAPAAAPARAASKPVPKLVHSKSAVQGRPPRPLSSRDAPAPLPSVPSPAAIEFERAQRPRKRPSNSSKKSTMSTTLSITSASSSSSSSSSSRVSKTTATLGRNTKMRSTPAPPPPPEPAHAPPALSLDDSAAFSFAPIAEKPQWKTIRTSHGAGVGSAGGFATLDFASMASSIAAAKRQEAARAPPAGATAGATSPPSSRRAPSKPPPKAPLPTALRNERRRFGTLAPVDAAPPVDPRAAEPIRFDRQVTPAIAVSRDSASSARATSAGADADVDGGRDEMLMELARRGSVMPAPSEIFFALQQAQGNPSIAADVVERVRGGTIVAVAAPDVDPHARMLSQLRSGTIQLAPPRLPPKSPATRPRPVPPPAIHRGESAAHVAAPIMAASPPAVVVVVVDDDVGDVEVDDDDGANYSAPLPPIPIRSPPRPPILQKE